MTRTPRPPRSRSAGDIGRATAAITITAALIVGGAIAPRHPASSLATLLGAPVAPTTASASPASGRPGTGSPGSPATSRASAYVVAQPRDCTSNLDFLTLFDRPPIRDRVALLGAIALGSSAAADTIRRTLAAHDLHLQVVPITPALAHALHTLGHRSTPYIVVLDASGTVRYTADAPPTRAATRHLAADLRQIADLAIAPTP